MLTQEIFSKAVAAIKNPPRPKNLFLIYHKSEWLRFIDAPKSFGFWFPITKQQVEDALSHPDGLIGRFGGVDCYVNKPIRVD